MISSSWTKKRIRCFFSRPAASPPSSTCWIFRAMPPPIRCFPSKRRQEVFVFLWISVRSKKKNKGQTGSRVPAILYLTRSPRIPIHPNLTQSLPAPINLIWTQCWQTSIGKLRRSMRRKKPKKPIHLTTKARYKPWHTRQNTPTLILRRILRPA